MAIMNRSIVRGSETSELHHVVKDGSSALTLPTDDGDESDHSLTSSEEEEVEGQPQQEDEVITEQRSPVTKSETKQPKTCCVSFDNIVIREYARCLGDNPATTCGPPLSIDWAYVEMGTFDLQEYENCKGPPRSKNEMLVPSEHREDIILEHTDVTRKQIKSAVAEIQAARHKRQMSVAMQEYEPHAIAFETLSRRFRRLRTGMTKKREQELLWENAQKVLAEKNQQAS